MKKAIFFILAALLLFINYLPSSIVFADDSGYSDSQLADVGALMLTSLISSGEATELDFSDYTQNEGLDFLMALGELAVTGDPSGLIDQGLSWLGGELDDAYQSIIEDIRAWEHDIAPDLYNWWYNGSKYEYKLEPTNNIARPLTNLLRAPSDTPQANPDPNYLQVLDVINGNGTQILTQYENSGLWVNGYSNNSFVRYLLNDNDIGSSSWSGNSVQTSDILTINIFSSGSTYNFTIQTIPTQHCNQSAIYSWAPISYTTIIYNWSDIGVINGQQNDILTRSRSGSLSQILYFISNNFKHVNIYVDNVPWSLVNNPTYPIVIPNSLTVLNNLPAQYSFSTPTYYDLNGLKTLITNAINNSDVITWQDIDDYFVDINGIQALPIVQVYRNDYDQLYIEQYPYPAKLIGMQDPLKFNEHMLDNYYGQYLTPMVDVTSNTLDVLPSEIKWVLGIGAILMIFAVIINRLLE